jgi:hypothetical protein
MNQESLQNNATQNNHLWVTLLEICQRSNTKLQLLLSLAQLRQLHLPQLDST